MSPNLKMTIVGGVVAFVSIGVMPLTEDIPGDWIRWASLATFSGACLLIAVALFWPPMHR